MLIIFNSDTEATTTAEVSETLDGFVINRTSPKEGDMSWWMDRKQAEDLCDQLAEVLSKFVPVIREVS